MIIVDRAFAGRGRKLPLRFTHPRIARAIDWLIACGVGVAVALALTGCGPARVLFLPGKCHPTEFVKMPDGSFVLSADPCSNTPSHP
jgi:hypothetical protein